MKATQFLYIIARDRLDLYRLLSTEFADRPEVVVMLDRRTTLGVPQHERRMRAINKDLETLGWEIVPR